MSDFAPYSGADIDNQLKILLVGDAGVGKSRSLSCEIYLAFVR